MSEESKVQNLKWWIENEAEFYGRTDNDFLLMFLRYCDFDISLAKKTLILYYQNRIKFPQWWANRNVDKLRKILNLRSITILMDKNLNLPTVAIVKLSSFGADSNIFDELLKLSSIGFEMMIRQPNCQKNGFICIFDCHNYPSWVVRKLLWPTTLKNILDSFYNAMPINTQKIIYVNSPPIAKVLHRICNSFIGQFGQKIHFLGSDLSKLGEHVPLEMLPEEYGGYAESFDQQHDAFLIIIQELKDYLVEDEKFGFLTPIEEK